jgi:hypothetical protein
VNNRYCSSDQGKTFEKTGFADVPNREFDVHMIVERQDKRLWMLVRTRGRVSLFEDFTTICCLSTMNSTTLAIKLVVRYTEY